MRRTAGLMPAKDTSSTIVVILIVALIAVLLYAAWRWVQRGNATPSAPMHSQLRLHAPGA